MVKQLKTHGSGKLPPNIQKRKTKHLTASANDAFATIRITARDCTEGCCDEALSYLVEVLEQPEFPRSYSIEFRGPEKLYLPIPGLPKKGVNQLFACAVRYPRLHVRMESYARLAMQEDEMYQNLSDEICALPGTFAVFALGLEGPKWWGLVCDYLDRCDDEHSSLQEKFIHAFFKKYGFTAQSLPVLVHGVQSMQNLKPAKEFRTLIANKKWLPEREVDLMYLYSDHYLDARNPTPAETDFFTITRLDAWGESTWFMCTPQAAEKLIAMDYDNLAVKETTIVG